MARISTTERGFSLVEIVIAIGIFASAVAVVLALFGPLNRSVTEVSDAARAARLAEAINVELLRIRDAFPYNAAQTRTEQFAATFASGPLTLVGSADGTRVVRESEATNDPVTGNPRGIAGRDQLYVIRISTPPGYTAGTLSYLPLTATVSWPYHQATGPGAADFVEATASQARSFVLNYALGP